MKTVNLKVTRNQTKNVRPYSWFHQELTGQNKNLVVKSRTYSIYTEKLLVDSAQIAIAAYFYKIENGKRMYPKTSKRVNHTITPSKDIQIFH